MLTSKRLKGTSAILLILTLTKRFFNNGMGNDIPIEIVDLIILTLYFGFYFFWSTNDDKDKVLDGLKLFILSFTIYFIGIMSTRLIFGRHILINLQLIPMLVVVVILYGVGYYISKE